MQYDKKIEVTFDEHYNQWVVSINEEVILRQYSKHTAIDECYRKAKSDDEIIIYEENNNDIQHHCIVK